jgi:hypothetical protein
MAYGKAGLESRPHEESIRDEQVNIARASFRRHQRSRLLSTLKSVRALLATMPENH